MALFGPTPKVPNTISDKQAASLRRRAQKAALENNLRDGNTPLPVDNTRKGLKRAEHQIRQCRNSIWN